MNSAAPLENHHGRMLLSLDPNRSTQESDDVDLKFLRQPLSDHPGDGEAYGDFSRESSDVMASRLVEHRALTSDIDHQSLNIWQNVRDLMLARKIEEEGLHISSAMCPTYFNSTESLRLVSRVV